MVAYQSYTAGRSQEVCWKYNLNISIKAKYIEVLQSVNQSKFNLLVPMKQTENNAIKSLLYCIKNYMDDNLETSTVLPKRRK